MSGRSVAFIDFEASGFTGYPIEVGFARLWSNGSHKRGAQLIYFPLWDRQEHLWDYKSEEVHGIPREEIRMHGKSPKDVMEWLNCELEGIQEVYCDGGHWDERWMKLLVYESGIAPTFSLKDIAVAFSDPDITDTRFEQAEKVFMSMPVPHRAAEDAWRLGRLFLHAAGWKTN